MRYLLALLFSVIMHGCGDKDREESEIGEIQNPNAVIAPTPDRRGKRKKVENPATPTSSEARRSVHKSPSYVQSKVERGGALHFVIDKAHINDRGVAGTPNGVNLCFIVSGLQLLLHADPFRDFLYELSNRSPPITAVSPVLEDMVYMFNKVWGDGWPNPPSGTYPKIRIHHRLYDSIVKKAKLQVRHGAEGDAAPFLDRLLIELKEEIDKLVPHRMEDLFMSQVVRTAPHVDASIMSYDHEPQHTIKKMTLEVFSPSGDYVDIDRIILNGFLGPDRFVDDFTHCDHQTNPLIDSKCDVPIDRTQLSGRWSKFPKILTFSIFEDPNAATPDPSIVLTFIDGKPVPSSDPRAKTPSPNRVQYDLVGYSVYVHHHYISVVRHFGTGKWYKVNDSTVTEIDSPDPRPIMQKQYRIANIMYVKRP